MASGNDRVERWVRKVLTDPILTAADSEKPRKCIALALMHATGGMRSEVQTLRLGNKAWDARQVAEMFNGIVDEHAAGLATSESGSGQEQYVLVAFYDDVPDLPQSPLPIMRRTGPMAGGDDHPLTSEPPNAQGMARQDMRHKEGWMQFALEMVARTYTSQGQIIDRLSNRLAAVEKENVDTFAIAKDMILEKAADSHDHKMQELAFERNSEERARLMKALPPIVNKVLGKEVFPQSAVDSSLFEGLIESLDEHTLTRLIEIILPKLPPETGAMFMARLGDIQIASNRRKAEAAAKASANGNGNGAAKS